jgi:hypothetical protein
MPECLYHATSIECVESIREHGLRPAFGRLTSTYHASFAQSETDKIPLVFARESPVATPVLSALTFRVSLATGKWARPISGKPKLHNLPLTDGDIARHGALVVIEETDAFEQHGWGMTLGAPPLGVEIEDWYSYRTVPAADILTGDALLSFLYENGLTGARAPQGWCIGFEECEGIWKAVDPIARFTNPRRPFPKTLNGIARVRADHEAALEAGSPFATLYGSIEHSLPRIAA